MTAGEVKVYPALESFIFGALPISPHPKLTISNIRRIPAYLLNKSKDWPQISFKTWMRMAEYKFAFPAQVGEILWNSYQQFERVPETTINQRKSHHNDLKSARGFLLFLALQHMHKINLKSSIVGGEEWPSPMRARSPDVSEGSAKAGVKSFDETQHFSFLLTNLELLLQLLIDPADPPTDPANPRLSREILSSLDLLLVASPDGGRSLTPFSSLLDLQHVQQQLQYSKLTGGFSVRQVESFIRGSLAQHPAGITATVASGKRLNWLSEMRQGGRVVASTNCTEAGQPHPLLIVAQVNKSTLERTGLDGANLKFYRCRTSFFYFLSPLENVNIDKCKQGCIVCLGPIRGTLYVNNCENITVIALAGRVQLTGCSHCTLFLLTPLSPLLVGVNTAITLAPYNTFYGNLEADMVASHLLKSPNLWDQPIVLTSDYTLPHTQPVTLMPPANFYLFNIPFERPGNTTAVPCQFPERYKAAYSEKERRKNELTKKVKAEGMTAEQQRLVQEFTESKFGEWLQREDHSWQISTLTESRSRASSGSRHKGEGDRGKENGPASGPQTSKVKRHTDL